MSGPERHVGLRARDTVVVVVTCSANVCRSPHLAFLLDRALPPLTRARVTILDGGVDVEPGQPPCRRVGRLLPGSGAALAGHLSTPVGEDLLHRADLIVAASRVERRRLAEQAPASRGRTFTAYEAIGSVGAIDPDDLAIVDGESARDRVARLTASMNRRRTCGVTWDIPDAHTSRTRHADVARHLRVASAGLADAVRTLVDGPTR